MSGAKETPTTPATDDVCDQRLAKTLDALEKAERLIGTLEAEIEARKRLEAVSAEIIRSKDSLITEQNKLIELLKKQTGRKISFAFGLIKIRY